MRKVIVSCLSGTVLFCCLSVSMPIVDEATAQDIVALSGTLSVVPSLVLKGGEVNIIWECKDADLADIQPGLGSVSLNGVLTVTPSKTTDYILTCSGSGSTIKVVSKVIVTLPPKPISTVLANPAAIIKDSSADSSIAPITQFPHQSGTLNLNIQFDTGRAVIKKIYHGDISRLAAFLKASPDVTGTIEGHTDNTGEEKVNISLSLRRAEAVLNYLENYFGIDRTRFSTVGYGSAKPIADNRTAEGQQKNRRTVVVFGSVSQKKK